MANWNHRTTIILALQMNAQTTLWHEVAACSMLRCRSLFPVPQHSALRQRQAKLYSCARALKLMGYAAVASPVNNMLKRIRTTCSVGWSTSQNSDLKGRLQKSCTAPGKLGGTGFPHCTCAFRNPAPQQAAVTLSNPVHSHRLC